MRYLFDNLDTPNGHIPILLFIMTGAVVMGVFKIPSADQILMGSFGALLLELKGKVNGGGGK